MRKNKSLWTYLSVFVFVVLLNFWLPRLLPGGPIEFVTGGEDSSVFLSEAQKSAMLDYYHLNDSLWAQFIQYIRGICKLDFGLSFSFKHPYSKSS